VLLTPVGVVGPEPPVAAPTTWVLLALAVLCMIVAPWVPLLWPVAAAAAGTAVCDAFLRRWRGARSLLARAAQPVDTGRYACHGAFVHRGRARTSTRRHRRCVPLHPHRGRSRGRGRLHRCPRRTPRPTHRASPLPRAALRSADPGLFVRGPKACLGACVASAG